MTFLGRMRTETHAPMPRWLYLLDKPCHTLAIAVVLHTLAGLAWPVAAWVALALYVGAGLVLWYRRGVLRWFGPGSFTGDALYHTLPSLPAPILLATDDRPVLVGLLVACLALWWMIDGAGYGPLRAGT